MTSEAVSSAMHHSVGSSGMRKTGARVALADMVESLRSIRVALVFGWQDVAQRYRRSRIGAFWLTLNTAIFIAAIGLIFGTLFRAPAGEFLDNTSGKNAVVYTHHQDIVEKCHYPWS